MKKSLMFALLFVSLIYPVSLMAASGGGYTGPAAGSGGGYTGPGPALKSAEEAKHMADDSHVAIRGHLVQHLGKDKYLFRDNSGTIEVEIDHDKWGGHEVGPNDPVEIYGEVDRGMTSVKIDAKRVVKLDAKSGK